MTSSTEQLAPALDVDARLTGIERGLTLLLNVTPVNAAKAWADFERSDFGTVPVLRLRPLEFEPLDREVLQPPWVRPRWLDVPGLVSGWTSCALGYLSSICMREMDRGEACLFRQRCGY